MDAGLPPQRPPHILGNLKDTQGKPEVGPYAEKK